MDLINSIKDYVMLINTIFENLTLSKILFIKTGKKSSCPSNQLFESYICFFL